MLDNKWRTFALTKDTNIPEELTAMFKVATEDDADMLKFILGSGFRDQEFATSNTLISTPTTILCASRQRRNGTLLRRTGRSGLCPCLMCWSNG
jgi:hypothetical protein